MVFDKRVYWNNITLKIISQGWGNTQNYRYRVGHFSKMTRLPVRFRNCPVVFLLSRPVNKYDVKVHESVVLQERLSVHLSVCPLPDLFSVFSLSKLTFHNVKNRQNLGHLSEWRRLCPRKCGKELTVPLVVHSCWRFRDKQGMTGLWSPLNRPLQLSIHHKKRLQKQSPLHNTVSTHCQKESTVCEGLETESKRQISCGRHDSVVSVRHFWCV